MASSMTRDKKPPYCLHHSHPCLTYGTLCFLAKTASTFRHSLCQMNSFANSRNTCRWPSWPAVELIDLVILAINARSWKHGQGNESCTLCTLPGLKGGGLQRKTKWQQMPLRGIREALTAGNRNLSHLSSFQMLLIPGFWGFWRIIMT